MSPIHLMQLMKRALFALPDFHRIPGIPGLEPPFDVEFSSEQLEDAIDKVLAEDAGFTVVLGYDDGQTYSGFSKAGTWREAVLDVAKQMFAGGGVSPGDDVSIIEVSEGIRQVAQAEIDFDATVFFDDRGVANFWDPGRKDREARFLELVSLVDIDYHDRCQTDPEADLESFIREQAASSRLIAEGERDEFFVWALPRLQEAVAKDAADRAPGVSTVYDDFRRLVDEISVPQESEDDEEEIPSDAYLVDDPITDHRICNQEGWTLFDVDSTGLLEIQRDDEAEMFAGDDEAVEFVRRRAGRSPYHRKAIVIHDRDAQALLARRIATGESITGRGEGGEA